MKNLNPHYRLSYLKPAQRMATIFILAFAAVARAQNALPQSTDLQPFAADPTTFNTAQLSAEKNYYLIPEIEDDNADSASGIDLMDAQPSIEPQPTTSTQPAPSTHPAPATEPSLSEHLSALEASPSSHPTTIPTTTVATQPEESAALSGNFPVIGGTYGLQEFISHFAPYEPMYFIGSTQAPNIKFQLSLRYRLFTPTGPLATKMPFFRGFNFGYSQTSFWDVSNPSEPFFYDTSYRPEFFYYLESLPGVTVDPGSQLGFQVGVGHESNGQLDPNHRSLNIVFIRPIVTIGGPSDLFITIAPKIYDYIGGLPLNPDLPKYRGYTDLRVVVGQRDGLQLALIGRVGRDATKGSAQFDLTYPLTKLLGGNMDLILDGQYFYGYGDTLLTYNQRTSIFRFGLAIVR